MYSVFLFFLHRNGSGGGFAAFEPYEAWLEETNLSLYARILSSLSSKLLHWGLPYIWEPCNPVIERFQGKGRVGAVIESFRAIRRVEKTLTIKNSWDLCGTDTLSKATYWRQTLSGHGHALDTCDTQFQNVLIFLHYFQLANLDALKLSPETLWTHVWHSVSKCWNFFALFSVRNSTNMLGHPMEMLRTLSWHFGAKCCYKISWNYKNE